MKQFLFYIFISFAFCSGQDSNDTRCFLYDSECQETFFQNVGINFASTGIPAIGVPVIDPFQVENVVLSILNLVNVSFQGEAVGIGRCIVKTFETNVDAMYRQSEVVCDKIIISGHYKITPAPIVGKICGWCNVNGEGNGTLTLENWYFRFKYPFKIVRREDNEIYLDPDFDNMDYEASVENLTLAAECIKMGDRDITDTIVCFVNDNWKLLMDSSIGKFINAKSAQYYGDIYDIFFTRVPARNIFKGDLTKYLEN